MTKFLSIVTIHLEDFEGLKRTAASIERLLNSPEFEWILVDGGSNCESATDEEILADAFRGAALHVAEPDAGIYDAMNKGTNMAAGEYVMYLNAGDELHREFDLGKLQSRLPMPAPGMIWGQCIECHAGGAEVELKSRSPAWAWYGMPVNHPAILFRKELLGTAPFDTGFRIAGDYDLVSRLLKAGAVVQSIPMPFSRYYKGGLSDVSHRATRLEEHRVRTRHFSVPRPISFLIQQFKAVLKKLSSVIWIRRIWRKRI
jgi:putative colanic acid biosynthesis glycosyltransferase